MLWFLAIYTLHPFSLPFLAIVVGVASATVRVLNVKIFLCQVNSQFVVVYIGIH